MTTTRFIPQIVQKVLFVLAISLACYGNSTESKQVLSTPEKLIIVRGVGNYPPLEMVINGRLTGLHIEMIRHIAYQLNIEVEFISLPWGRQSRVSRKGSLMRYLILAIPSSEQNLLITIMKKFYRIRAGFFLLQRSEGMNLSLIKIQQDQTIQSLACSAVIAMVNTLIA